MLRGYGSEAYVIAPDQARRPLWFWTRVAIKVARFEARESGQLTSDRDRWW